jgi:large subunit ribosomal protein L5
MYEFLDRLITIALPRVKDFRGLNGRLVRRPRQLRHGPQGTHRVPRDQLRPDRSDLGHGHHRLHHGADDDEARALLKEFNFPFRDPN